MQCIPIIKVQGLLALIITSCHEERRTLHDGDKLKEFITRVPTEDIGWEPLQRKREVNTSTKLWKRQE